MKFICLFSLFFSFNFVFAQNKKEQIIELNKSIDSLKTVHSKDSVLIVKKDTKIKQLLKNESNHILEISKLKNELERINEICKSNEKTIIDLRSKFEDLKKKNNLSNCLVIKSNQKIKGFDLEIIHYPKEEWGTSEVKLYQGYTVFNFLKDGKIFPFQFDSFSLPLYTAKKIQYSEDSSQILNCPFQELVVDLDSLPISFKDFNFDNKDELIITNQQGGQRLVNSYIPFQLTDNSIINVSYWVKDEFFDEMTEFNVVKKQISFENSNGADSSYTSLYQAVFDNGNFSYFKLLKKIPN
jgi:cell division protein FtsB